MFIAKSGQASFVGAASSLRPLQGSERIKGTDFVEDIASGRRVKVHGSFYSFLKGQRANSARQLPDVFDIVRP